jgi:hypothetical protein
MIDDNVDLVAHHRGEEDPTSSSAEEFSGDLSDV